MSDTDTTPHKNINETGTVNQTLFYTVVLQGAISLQNIVDDPGINQDAKFLDDLPSTVDDAEVSTISMPHMQKFCKALGDARKSIQKRIEDKQLTYCCSSFISKT